MFTSSKHLALLALCIAAGSAMAADPVRGTTKFADNCSRCHSVASTEIYDRGRNSPAFIEYAIKSISAMRDLSSLSTKDLEDIAAYLGDRPAKLDFPGTPVGQTSSSKTITIKGSEYESLNQLTISVKGSFSRTGGSCGSKLPKNGKCTIKVAFEPTAAGAASGKVIIQHSAISTSIPIVLTGVGKTAQDIEADLP